MNQQTAAFLKLNYQLLAAMAWQGYQEFGRGVVWIDVKHTKQPKFDNLSEREAWLMKVTPGIYIGEKSPIFQDKLKGKWIDKETAQLVQTYPPEQIALVLIMYEDGEFTVNRLGSPLLPPPLAYQQLAPRLAEYSFIKE